MSELRTLLSDTTEKVLKDLPADFDAAWTIVADAGLANVMLAEDAGGFGGGWEDALVVIRATGQHATQLPLADAILGAHLISRAGLPARDGFASFSVETSGRIAGTKFSGKLRDVPSGRSVQHVVGVLDGALIVARRADATAIDKRQSPADEARDTLRFDGATVETTDAGNTTPARLFELGALLRTAQIAGAMEAALALCVEYTRQRQQFGKPLASFQAIQQQLAVLAEETAAAGMAAASAFRAADRGEASFEIAAAKLRVNRAVTLGNGIAHQVHGAMGFTAEYRLQHLTRRLWAWQSEFGNERYWADRIGAGVAARGAENFWADLVAVSDQ